MAELIDLSELQEKVILVAVSTAEEEDTPASLDELEELASTAGAVTVARIIQNRERVHPGTYLGKGKIDEVRELLWDTRATGVICDDELSPAQLRNLEDALDTKVMDRTMVILDIFASRASTREGKIQVELAQLKYRAVRLVGMRNSLSRLGGGIGTRGPGEKKLETDRRLIHQRIGQLKEELADVKRHREVTRQQREKNFALSAAIVGYTNAGKSTLLNRLTGAGIPANNRLFDTLDTTARQLELSDTLTVIVSDTVGFIAKLPHHLVEAFRATLEELQYADLLVHVIDSADPERAAHIEVVNHLIAQLAKPGVPVLEVYNKADLVTSDDLPRGADCIPLSAKTGAGAEELLRRMEQAVGPRLHHAVFLLPYSMAGQVEQLHLQAKVLACEYETDGIRMEAICDDVLFGRLQACVVEVR